MEEQVPPSQYPVPEGAITVEQLEEMKARARELAVRQALTNQMQPIGSFPGQQPRVVYVRRNLTVAELLVVFLISCGIVTGIQMTWNGISNFLPKIEVRVK